MVACSPVSGKSVAAWLKVAVSHEAVVWHVSQVVAKPTLACGGVVVAAYFAWWQLAQSVDFPAYTPSPWHEAQGVVRCTPVSGKSTFEWSKVAVSQDAVEWQSAQVSGKPDAACGGVAAPVYSAWWQLAQSVDFPL